LFGKIPRTMQELEICGVVNIAINTNCRRRPFPSFIAYKKLN